MRQARKNLWTGLNSRLHGLAGDLTAQLAADLDAVDHERRATPFPGGRYVDVPKADWWLNTAQDRRTVSR